MTRKTVRIGGASGTCGDSVTGAIQLVDSGQLDYLVFDYLSELTMSVLASARLKNPAMGYATDFVSVAMRSVLKDALAQGIRIIANAGGVNPRACADALASLAAELGVEVGIAVVEGDDVMPQLAALRAEGVPLPDKVLSANACLGALPIRRALDAGAQVVITGRCVDSAVTLGALLHEFDWRIDDYDRIAAASLAGHLIECGCQGIGGLHTDWEAVPDWAHSGYPIVACGPDGSFSITKPAGSGGLVTPATVAEQLLHAIGDPARYILPDVVCDFTAVTLEQAGPDVVRVRGAKGYPPTPTYQVGATYADGYRCNAQLTVVGFDAERKAGVASSVKQASFLIGKQRLVPSYALLAGGGVAMPVPVPPGAYGATPVAARCDALAQWHPEGDTVMVPLIWLAYARSGDMGDISNVGVIARRPEYLPLLRGQLTIENVATHLAHLVGGTVTRFELPGIHALNFVCEPALGAGAMASLRHDALGQGMAQLLLAMPVRVPARFVVS